MRNDTPRLSFIIVDVNNDKLLERIPENQKLNEAAKEALTLIDSGLISGATDFEYMENIEELAGM